MTGKAKLVKKLGEVRGVEARKRREAEGLNKLDEGRVVCKSKNLHNSVGVVCDEGCVCL